MAITKAPGTWTYEDLVALPDDGKRYEIIDGELYEMPAPTWAHQIILAALHLLFAPEARRVGARLGFAPLDVILTADHRRTVQPDLYLVMPERLGIIKPHGIQGAPDLVLEILSPSNSAHDLVVKRRLYALSGVREYWIVDPASRIIEVLALVGEGYRSVVSASGDQPVSSTVLPGLSFPASAAFEDSAR